MSTGQEEGHHQDGARMEASAHHPRSALRLDRGEPCEATSHLPAWRDFPFRPPCLCKDHHTFQRMPSPGKFVSFTLKEDSTHLCLRITPKQPYAPR